MCANQHLRDRRHVGALLVSELGLTPLGRDHPGGKGNFVILSEANSLGVRETVRLLSSPWNAERPRASIRALDAGQGVGHELAGDEGFGLA